MTIAELLTTTPSTSPRLPPNTFEVSIIATGRPIMAVTTNSAASAIEFAAKVLEEKGITVENIDTAEASAKTVGPDASSSWVYTRDLRLNNDT